MSDNNIDHVAIDKLRADAFKLSTSSQFRLATYIAENVGYALVDERQHHDHGKRVNAKVRITIDVDNGELFDRLHALHGDFTPLGTRLVGVLLSGRDPGMMDRLGMAYYGIEVKKIETLPLIPAAKIDGDQTSAVEER